MKTLAAQTLEIYNQLGILKDCKNLSVRFNQDKKMWEVNGKFQNANGIKVGKVAEFEKVEDAIDFQVLAGF